MRPAGPDNPSFTLHNGQPTTRPTLRGTRGSIALAWGAGFLNGSSARPTMPVPRSACSVRLPGRCCVSALCPPMFEAFPPNAPQLFPYHYGKWHFMETRDLPAPRFI